MLGYWVVKQVGVSDYVLVWKWNFFSFFLAYMSHVRPVNVKPNIYILTQARQVWVRTAQKMISR